MARFDKTESIDIGNLVVDKKRVYQAIEETSLVPSKSTDTDKSVLQDIVKNEHQGQTVVDMHVVDEDRIGIAADHRGFNLKQKLTKYLNKIGYTVVDYGGDGFSNDDYTEFGFKLGEAISNHEVSWGIAICGSGIGISMACNKVKSVRCAKVNNVKETRWARRDNDANVIAFSSKIPLYKAKDIVDIFLATKFSYKERHQKRVTDLNDYKG
ncbi:MAG: RpiB/LacA/LacB family sugar-phosphate isomerase [Bacilli bacterium]|nr:RpiB/LacA/LacB family sugar-phosphate isomerase [Bacilli bacterium]